MSRYNKGLRGRFSLIFPVYRIVYTPPPPPPLSPAWGRAQNPTPPSTQAGSHFLFVFHDSLTGRDAYSFNLQSGIHCCNNIALFADLPFHRNNTYLSPRDPPRSRSQRRNAEKLSMLKMYLQSGITQSHIIRTTSSASFHPQ